MSNSTWNSYNLKQAIIAIIFYRMTKMVNSKRTTTDAVSRNYLNRNLIDEYSEIKFQIEQMENGIDDYFE